MDVYRKQVVQIHLARRDIPFYEELHFAYLLSIRPRTFYQMGEQRKHLDGLPSASRSEAGLFLFLDLP